MFSTLAKTRFWSQIRKLQTLGVLAVAILLPASYGICSANKFQETEPIIPIPSDLTLSEQKVSLGEMLFNEHSLSVDGKYNCSTCHNLQSGGVDNRKNPKVRTGKQTRNVPTLFNSRFNLAQVWDGRFKNIEDDTEATITSKQSFSSTWPELIKRLKQNRDYRSLFKMAYKDGITKTNVIDAISTFVRSLVTTNAPFDRFLKGDHDAISQRAKLGYKYFKSYGCTACHNGVSVGGNMFQRIGVTRDYFKDKLGIINPDVGRMVITGLEEDRYIFKVPSLRLATRTAPYFHDGSVETLDEAIKVMGRYQLGRDIPPRHIELIIDFLHTLRGEYKGRMP